MHTRINIKQMSNYQDDDSDTSSSDEEDNYIERTTIEIPNIVRHFRSQIAHEISLLTAVEQQRNYFHQFIKRIDSISETAIESRLKNRHLAAIEINFGCILVGYISKHDGLINVNTNSIDSYSICDPASPSYQLAKRVTNVFLSELRAHGFDKGRGQIIQLDSRNFITQNEAERTMTKIVNTSSTATRGTQSSQRNMFKGTYKTAVDFKTEAQYKKYLENQQQKDKKQKFKKTDKIIAFMRRYSDAKRALELEVLAVKDALFCLEHDDAYLPCFDTNDVQIGSTYQYAMTCETLSDNDVKSPNDKPSSDIKPSFDINEIQKKRITVDFIQNIQTGECHFDTTRLLQDNPDLDDSNYKIITIQFECCVRHMTMQTRNWYVFQLYNI